MHPVFVFFPLRKVFLQVDGIIQNIKQGPSLHRGGPGSRNHRSKDGPDAQTTGASAIAALILPAEHPMGKLGTEKCRTWLLGWRCHGVDDSAITLIQ